MDLTKVGDIFKRKEGDLWSAKGIKAEDLFLASSCRLQGTRPALEDRLALCFSPLATPYSLFLGVYDGHGGERCAEFVSAAVPRLICANPFLSADPSVALGDAHIQARQSCPHFIFAHYCVPLVSAMCAALVCRAHPSIRATPSTLLALIFLRLSFTL